MCRMRKAGNTFRNSLGGVLLTVSITSLASRKRRTLRQSMKQWASILSAFVLLDGICCMSWKGLCQIFLALLSAVPVFASHNAIGQPAATHTGSCRHELDITALTGCLEREEKARTQEAAEHATAAAALQKNIADLQASMHCAGYLVIPCLT